MRFDILFRRLPGMVLVAAALALSGEVHVASAAQPTTLYSFCAQTACTDGSEPSPVVADPAGNLYGAAHVAVKRAQYVHYRSHFIPFELKAAKKFKPLRVVLGGNVHSHDLPSVFSFVDAAGNLYGIAPGKNGTGEIIELARETGNRKWLLHVLYIFCPQGGLTCPAGSYPAALTYQGATAGVPYDGKSPLFGALSYGGQNGHGAVFELVQSGGLWSESLLYNFCSQPNCTDGDSPNSLIADATGNFFGTTADGGAVYYAGTIFQLTNTGGIWTETVLYNFCSASNCADGSVPEGLAEDSSGTLYGVAAEGGLPCKIQDLNGYTCGVAYKLVPAGASSKYSVLYEFCSQQSCADGAEPQTVTFSSGSLYGTTFFGGSGNIGTEDPAGGGTVFRLGSEFDLLHSFCSRAECADGYFPTGPLVVDPSGTVFGSTWYGGAHRGGTVFRIDP